MDEEQYEKDVALFQQMKDKSDDELHNVILEGNSDEKHAAASLLTTRGGVANFHKALEFCISADPAIRDKGAFVLGQLGAQVGRHERPFSQESAPILIELLENDEDEDVRASAAFALGHLINPIAVPYLIKHANDKSAEVRHGVAFALCSFGGQDVADILIVLSADPDRDVRDWATTALGSFLEMDTREIRDALVARLGDEDDEIRGEALIGLAERKDERVIEPLKRELSGEFWGSWCLEAAELMADPAFYPLLLSLRERIASEGEERFLSDADRAIAACKP